MFYSHLMSVNRVGEIKLVMYECKSEMDRSTYNILIKLVQFCCIHKYKFIKLLKTFV